MFIQFDLNKFLKKKPIKEKQIVDVLFDKRSCVTTKNKGIHISRVATGVVCLNHIFIQYPSLNW